MPLSLLTYHTLEVKLAYLGELAALLLELIQSWKLVKHPHLELAKILGIIIVFLVTGRYTEFSLRSNLRKLQLNVHLGTNTASSLCLMILFRVSDMTNTGVLLSF